MQRRKPFLFVIILIALLVAAVFRLNQNKPIPDFDNRRQKGGTSTGGDAIHFDRTISKIVYTKHAKCRMACRQIDESEILEIKEEGKVNDSKSEPNSTPDPKFAVEGITHDKQHVRIVFAQTSNSLVVVTCIDLDTDYECHCN